jgi:peptidoglycan/xylan/chitin deacetylase (PgdA/CDA1 family)
MTPAIEILLGGTALAGAAAGGFFYATYGVRSQWLGPTDWRGRTDVGAVALTFDDGPSDDTQRVLDVLAERAIKATFFVVGRFVEERPAIARRIVSDGHGIGNHSYSHPIYLYRSAREIYRQLARTQAIVADATGVTPVLSRPPCGVRTPAYFKACRELGLRTIQWTVAGFDWRPWPSERIASTVLAGCAPGAIVLLHDGDGFGTSHRQQTVAAIGPIVEGAANKNLRIAPLQRLLDRGESIHA